MTIEEIISEIENMSVSQLAELVKALEEKFGVSASMPVAVAAPVAGPQLLLQLKRKRHPLTLF